MEKLLFGVFAHPDDEAFGPSATLRRAVVEERQQLHLICVTDGANGTNRDNVTDLGITRREEWSTAAALIGAHQTHWLGYEDGTLCNNLYHEIAEKIISIIRQAAEKSPSHIELMTFEPKGLSGHLDHVAVSLITTCVYLKLPEIVPQTAVVGNLRYYCLSDKVAPHANTDWLYMPAGRDDADEINKLHSYHDDKIAIMRAHYSQREDADSITALMGDDLTTEYFCYYR